VADAGLIAVVAGATGLTGRALVEQLRKDSRYAKTIALVRRSGSILADARVEECVVDFGALVKTRTLPITHADHAFCCLGTTIKVAGSQAAFRKVDFDAVVAFAAAVKAKGARHLSVVSALGASNRSSVFYNRVKGEMEQAVTQLGYVSVHLLRPSLLLGLRSERRAGELAGPALANFIGPLLLGPVRKYRPIHADVVARAMRVGAAQDKSGLRVSESDQIAVLGASASL
jgi:uncharacterized protein YbjT (DUF2867 family)